MNSGSDIVGCLTFDRREISDATRPTIGALFDVPCQIKSFGLSQFIISPEGGLFVGEHLAVVPEADSPGGDCPALRILIAGDAEDCIETPAIGYEGFRQHRVKPVHLPVLEFDQVGSRAAPTDVEFLALLTGGQEFPGGLEHGGIIAQEQGFIGGGNHLQPLVHPDRRDAWGGCAGRGEDQERGGEHESQPWILGGW